MSAARQRVLRACGCTGGGRIPNAVQRHTVRSLIANRRATARTVSKSGLLAGIVVMSVPREKALFSNVGLEASIRDIFEHTVLMYRLQEEKIAVLTETASFA